VSDRWSPKQLKREREAQIARGEVPREQQLEALKAELQQLRAQAALRLEGSRRIVHCNHGVPWLDCRDCSTPRSGR